MAFRNRQGVRVNINPNAVMPKKRLPSANRAGPSLASSCRLFPTPLLDGDLIRTGGSGIERAIR